MSEARLALSVVVPAFEEQRRLTATLASITSYLAQRTPAAEVIVVDDGSSDDTFAIASAWGEPVRALRLPHNQGKGAALRHGVLASRGEQVLLCDADLSTPIEELEKLEAALAAGADLACGSRSVAGSQVRLRQARYRELMGRCFNLCLHLLGFGGLQDTQCGFKLLDGDSARALFAATQVDRFAYDVELIELARRSGKRVAEVGVVWINSPDSRVHPLRDPLHMLADVVRLRMRRFGSRRPS